MGGRGGSSGMNHSDLHFSNKEIDNLTDSAIEFIKKQDNVYGTLTKGRENEFRGQIKRAYQKGFSGLPDGTILDRNPKNQNNYIVKENGGAAMYKFTSNPKQSHIAVNAGIVVGDKGKKQKTFPLIWKRKEYTPERLSCLN